MADNDIESYWEGIRPTRESVVRDMPQVGDLRQEIRTNDNAEVAVLIRVLATHGERVLIQEALESVIDQATRRGIPIDQFSEGISGLNPGLLRTLTHWYYTNGPFLSWGSVPDEIVEALDSEGAEASPIRREEGLRVLSQYAIVPETREELEALQTPTPAGGFPSTQVEWARFFENTVPRWILDHERNLLQRDLGREPTLEEMNQALLAAESWRRTGPMQPSQRELYEMAQLPVYASLQEPLDSQGQMIMRHNESIEDFTNRVSRVRGSYSFTPRGDNNQSEDNPLSRLNDALAALGFPPSSINIESSQTEGTRLTINMSPSIEFETDSSPDEVSVTLSHRR